jgi:NADH-quinone oxidoreductase subunit I
MGYFRNIYTVSKSIMIGMGLTIRYFFNPSTTTTLQYPHEKEVLPERHRGIHYLETEKCILCYKCSNACPVDCIAIEGTRDGSIEGAYIGEKCEITKFTIDYTKCIFCNLCCEPCPKLCIHMGPDYDFSGYTREEMVKNLLTGDFYNAADRSFVRWARGEIDRLAEEKKRAKAEAAAKKKAAAAKAAAAKAAAEKKKAEAKPEPDAGGGAKAKPDGGGDGGTEKDS